MASRWLRLAEFAVWVVAVAAAVSGAAILVGYVVGGDLVGAKYAVFVVGVLMFGLGSLGIQPTPSYKDEKRVTTESTHQNEFERRLQSVPPLRDAEVPFDQRISRDKKVFVASLLVLGVSLFMEFGLGIRV